MLLHRYALNLQRIGHKNTFDLIKIWQLLYAYIQDELRLGDQWEKWEINLLLHLMSTTSVTASLCTLLKHIRHNNTIIKQKSGNNSMIILR